MNNTLLGWLGATIVVGSLVIVIGAVRAERSAIDGDHERTAGANTTGVIASGFSPYVDDNGKIRLPGSYRQNWTHLGSWAVAKNPGRTVHEMHDVYTQPSTVDAFNRTGRFPDGAVIVKEVREAKADALTTGHTAWSTGMKVWFVMVKDHQGRFKESDHWGDGWGWALFDAKDPTKNVSTGYDTSCLSCHTPVKDSDWVFTYGYPNLRQPE